MTASYISPYGTQQPNQNQPNVEPYFQQQNNPTAAGAVNNMIRAILAGNDAYQNKMQGAQGAQPLALPTGSSIPGAAGPTSVGGPNGPMPLAGATSPAAMTGGVPNTATSNPFVNGTSPVTMDPVSQALMSPIPGFDPNSMTGA